jgi:hypothetical protein
MNHTELIKLGIPLDGGRLIINARLTLAEFRKSSIGALARPRSGGIESEYKWYLVDRILIDGRKCWMRFCFHDDVLYIASLNADVTESDFNSPPATHERVRLENSEFLLKSFGIVDGKEYPWGRAISVYDERAGYSEVRILFNHHTWKI